METNKIAELEERIKFLEDKLNNISFNEAKEIVMNNCPIGDIKLGDNCNLNTHSSPIGIVISGDIDEAEERIDELQDRLDDINDGIDEAESKLDDLKS